VAVESCGLKVFGELRLLPAVICRDVSPADTDRVVSGEQLVPIPSFSSHVFFFFS
jgi:hypothetical protein